MLESGFVLGLVIFVEFKRCTKSVHVPHGSGSTQGMDIVYVDTPAAKVLKNLALIMSIFLLGLIPKVPRSLRLSAKILARASWSCGPT
jgi:hypothetical protein